MTILEAGITFPFDGEIGLDAFYTPPPPPPVTIHGENITWDFDQGFCLRNSSVFTWQPTLPPYKVSIAGKSYAVDLSFEPYRREAYRHRSIISQRESLNFDNISGENVVNTSGLWRRNFIDWSLGAGQLFGDHRRAAENRFLSSKGINVWTQWQAMLHNDTAMMVRATAADRWCRPHSAGPYQYKLEHTSLVFYDIRTANHYAHPTMVSGLPAVTSPSTYYQGIAHNDSFVFIACGSNGVYYAPLGGGGAAQYVAPGTITSGDNSYTVNAFDSVFWGADNLWATSAEYVLNFGGDGAFVAGDVPAADNLLPVNVGSYWRWQGWAEGNSQIYLGGYNYNGGVITDGSVYRIGEQIQTNATGDLTTTSTTYFAPVQALPLPPGEYPTSLFPYLNYIILGTNRGVRVCETLSIYDPTATSTGDLKGGPYFPNILQPVTRPVTSIVADDRFIYFAWNDYDAGSTGLGRADITNFIDELAPAYASDLMVTGQGDVYLDWDHYNDAPLIGVSGTQSAGIYNIVSTYVKSGTINSGWLGFDIPEPKTLLDFQPQFSLQAGSLDLTIIADGGAPLYIESWEPAFMNDLYAIDPSIQTDKAQIVLKLHSSADHTQTPIMNRWTLKAMPNVASETTISAVIDLFRSVEEEDCVGVFNPYVEYFNLDIYRRNQTIIPFVEGPLSADVVITQLDWLPENRRDDAGPEGFNGVLVVYMQTLNGYQLSDLALA
jgi:hypothetical protein